MEIGNAAAQSAAFLFFGGPEGSFLKHSFEVQSDRFLHIFLNVFPRARSKYTTGQIRRVGRETSSCLFDDNEVSIHCFLF